LITCIFANKVREPKRKHELISQFHPLIRFVSAQLHQKDEAFYPLVAVKLASNLANDYLPGSYAFYVCRWVFSGIKVEEELPVRSMHLVTGSLLTKDDSWNLLNLARVDGSDWLEANNSLDMHTFLGGLEHCSEMLEEDYHKSKNQRKNENTDRITFQIESAERHRDRHLRTQYETLAKHRVSGNTRMIPATEGKIRKIKERFDVQKEKLKQKSELTSSQFEVCCGVILVQ
jgi:hypothetical protein